MADLPDPVTLAIPGFIILIIVELLVARRRDPAAYEARDTATSLLLGLGSTVAGVVTGGAVLAIALTVAEHRLFDIGWAWWAWGLCFLLDDLAYYAFHRSAHRVRWFWASHVVHHSSHHYNFSTALRQTWTGFFSLAFLFRLPLFLIGFPVGMVLVCAGVNLVYQFWIHTEQVDRLPRWVEGVMNTPSHHRVHHGTHPSYLDANYAGVFIIWDRLFGTFVPEDDALPRRYGLVHPLRSFNPVWAALHEWVGIARDVARAPWGAKAGYLLREPGWSHDGSRMTSAMIKAAAARRAADAPAVGQAAGQAAGRAVGQEQG